MNTTIAKRGNDYAKKVATMQTQIVPCCGNNLLEYPTLQYHFALGTKPDAIILCVNYYDDIQYIRRSIFTLAGLTEATIISLVMYPKTFSDNSGNIKRRIAVEEYQEKANELTKELGVPVLLLGDEKHMNDLVQMIINYF